MKLPLTLALLLPALAGLAQTTLTNDGGTITVETGAVLYVAGTVQNNATGTLGNAGTVQLTGDLRNAGALTSSGTLLFSGTTNQVLTPGAATVTNLTLNNAGAVGQRTLSIPADLTLTGQLTLLNGLVRTAPVGATAPLGTLTLPAGATVTGEAAGRYVQGNLRVLRPSVNAGPVDFTNGLVLYPQGQDLGTVTVTRTAGLQTAGLSYGTGLNPKGIDRVWQVESSQGAQPTAATPATVALSWVSDDDNGFVVGAIAQLWRGASAAGPWARQGTAVVASSRQFSGSITQLGFLTVSNDGVALPVELVRFTAEPQGADALLKWATASEKNNDRFEVEASADGLTFRRIGQVAGHGSSTQAHEYQLVDPAIAHYAANPVYYRLRQVDLDGTFSYSPIRTVALTQPLSHSVALFPNPTTRATTLVGALPGTTVTVFDAVGRQLTAATADATGTAALVLPQGLATGVYLVRVGATALRLVVE